MSGPTPSRSMDSFDQVLQAARRGDKDAQGRLLETCRRPLLRLARRLVHPLLQSKGGGSDAVQETFLKALREIDAFQGCTPEQLLAWLRAILANSVVSLVRRFHTGKRQIQREIGGEPEVPVGPSHSTGRSADEIAIRREEVDILDRTLGRLPPHYAQVIRLRFGEKRSFEEIGRLTGRTTDGARKVCVRALKDLGQMLPVSLRSCDPNHPFLP